MVTVFKHYRYKAKALPQKPNCSHDKKKVYNCEELGMQDIRRFHERFYSNVSKSDQDVFILKYTEQESPKRIQIDKRSTQVVIRYFIPTKNKRRIQVGNKDFFHVFNYGTRYLYGNIIILSL